MKILNPAHWNFKFYVWVGALLLATNLFGSKGILHWLLMKQELSRLEAQQVDTQKHIDQLKQEMLEFKSSEVVKMRKIREELGFLAKDEQSVEIISNLESKRP